MGAPHRAQRARNTTQLNRGTSSHGLRTRSHPHAPRPGAHDVLVTRQADTD
ncbi:hypothetical protein SMCF_2903, partial [Streptomyces coelicoflavus ZG0656]